MSRFTPLPSERIAAWHATVSDSAQRAPDEQLLLDLLVIEEDDARRREVAVIPPATAAREEGARRGDARRADDLTQRGAPLAIWRTR